VPLSLDFGPASALARLGSRRDLCALLAITMPELDELVSSRHKDYVRFQIPKKAGGSREILAPSPPLLALQQVLLPHLYELYEPRPSTQGFVRGRSIVSNAREHLDRRWVFNVDLEDFFPSINRARIFGLLRSPPYRLRLDVARALADICTVENALPIGAPTSPVLSNMICRRLDGEMQNLARRTGCWYTRYADDITLSSNRKDFPVDIGRRTGLTAEVGPQLRAVIESNWFSVNESKTRLHTHNDRQVVTGLVVNERTNVDRRFVRDIRGMLHVWEKYGIEEAQKNFNRRLRSRGIVPKRQSFKRVLKGKIAFVHMVKGKDDPVTRSLWRQFNNLENGRLRTAGLEDVESSRDGMLRILHLSDVHFSKNTSWDSDPVLAGLCAILPDHIDQADLVLVTGDVANSGAPAEYGLASKWFTDKLLRAVRCGPQNLFLVPGNHDVDRAVKNPARQMAIESVLSLDNTALQVRIGEIVEHGPTLRSQLEPLQAYVDFVKEIRGDDVCAPAWWTHEVPIGDKRVTLAGLNSAWFSSSDADRGKLVLGLRQVNEVTNERGDLCVALIHHPDDYLLEADRPSMQAVTNWADLILRGHLHAELGESSRSTTGAHVELAAGALYQGSTWGCAAQIIEYDTRGRTGRVKYLRWDPDRRQWMHSRDVAPDDEDGTWKFGIG
jgi:RNA-directed DNA polymerase